MKKPLTKLEIAVLILLALGLASLFSVWREKANEKVKSGAERDKKEAKAAPTATPKLNRSFEARSDRSSKGNLAEVLDGLARSRGWKIYRNPAVDGSIATAIDDPSATQTVRNLAERLGLAAAGDLKGLQDGTTQDIHVTSDAIYAGSDAKALEMLDRLASASAEERIKALEAMAEYEWPDGKAGLEPVVARSLAKDPDPEVRIAATKGLEAATAPDTLDILVSALSDPVDEVRENARATLGLIGGDPVRERLRAERVRVTDPAVRAIIDQILEQVLDEPLSIEP